MVNVYYYDLEVKQIYLVLLSPLAYAVWIEIVYNYYPRDYQRCHRLRMRCGSKFLGFFRCDKLVTSPLAYAVWIEINHFYHLLTIVAVTACVCGVDRNPNLYEIEIDGKCHRLRMRCGSKYNSGEPTLEPMSHRLRMRCGSKFLRKLLPPVRKLSPLAYAVWIEMSV